MDLAVKSSLIRVAFPKMSMKIAEVNCIFPAGEVRCSGLITSQTIVISD